MEQGKWGEALPVLEKVVLVLLLFVGAAVRIANLGNVTSRTPDERVYARQATVWIESGRSGIRSLMEEYKRDSITRYYPMPTRAGMIRLLSSTMELTGRRDENAGAILSSIASIASLFLVGLIAVRFLPPWVALPAMLLHDFFPPELAIARRTWTDALTELVALVLVWLTCEIMRNPRRLWYVAFAAAGGIGITIKESMPMTWAICGAWALGVMLKDRRDWRHALLLTGASVAGAAIAVFWMASMAGSLSDLMRTVTGIAGVIAVNPYSLEHTSGPGYLLLDGLWIVSPMIAILAAAGIYVAVRRPAELAGYHRVTLWIALFTLANMALAMVMPHWLNLRYVSVAFGTYCLLAGLGAWYVFSLMSRQLPRARRSVLIGAGALVLLAGAAGDYRRFRNIFVRDATPDLSIRMLRESRDR